MLTSNMIPSQDVYICQYFPSQNFGDSQYLFISLFNAPGEIYRTLLQFDLNNNNVIPKVSTIKSAKLILDIFRNDVQQGGITLSVHRIYNSFDQSLVTWNTQPAFSAVADATASIAPGVLGAFEVDISDLVKGWHDGSIPNNGMMLIGDESKSAIVGFRSSLYPNSNLWPKLIINYVEGIQTIYPTETINLPETGAVASTPISLSGSNIETSFLINLVTPSISVDTSVEISVDGINYYQANGSFDDDVNFSLSIYQTAQWARVKLKSRTGAGTVKVTPVTWEG